MWWYLAGVLTIPASIVLYVIVCDLHYTLGETLFELRCILDQCRVQKKWPKWRQWPIYLVKLTWKNLAPSYGKTTSFRCDGTTYQRTGWCSFEKR